MLTEFSQSEKIHSVVYNDSLKQSTEAQWKYNFTCMSIVLPASHGQYPIYTLL